MNLPANFLDCEQGTSAWFAARCGMVTSCRVAAAIARLKRKSKSGDSGDPSAARINLRYEIIGEILTGKAAEHYVSEWMEAGKENEPLARAAYEMIMDTEITQVGFVVHPSIDRCGASPDGLDLSNHIITEYKCPKLETHLRYIAAGVVPEEYKPQMYWQMACCGPEWLGGDFVSHHPDLPPHLQTFIAPRLDRNDLIITEMEHEVKLFWAEVEAEKAKILANMSGNEVIESRLRQSIALVKSKQQKEQEALADEVVL